MMTAKPESALDDVSRATTAAQAAYRAAEAADHLSGVNLFIRRDCRDILRRFLSIGR
jgi:hypothetical protein